MVPLLSSFNWWRIESSLISFSSNHAKNISDANLKIAPNDIVIEMFQYNLFIKTKKDLSLTNILSNTDRSSVNWPKIIDNVEEKEKVNFWLTGKFKWSMIIIALLSFLLIMLGIYLKHI